VVVCDLDEEGAGEIAESLAEPGIPAKADVTERTRWTAPTGALFSSTEA
jgi:hypothetical protein